MKINFEGMQAILWRCPICKERFVGGPPGEDEETGKWVERHGKWHETSALAPPANLILP